VGFTTGSRGKVPGKTCEKRIRNYNNSLHYSICKTLGIETTESSHIAKWVSQREDITVLWHQGVQTDREVLANRPEIIIKNMKDKICERRFSSTI
jgi:hypothetical protein